MEIFHTKYKDVMNASKLILFLLIQFFFIIKSFKLMVSITIHMLSTNTFILNDRILTKLQIEVFHLSFFLFIIFIIL